jgi:hypothetical protein
MRKPQAAAAIFAVCLTVLSVTGCKEDKPDASPTATADASGAPSAPAEAPAITVEERTSAVDSPYPIDLTVGTPVLTGVRPEVVAAFDTAFETMTTEEVTLLEEALDSIQPSADNPDGTCQKTRGGWETTQFTVSTEAVIYEQYATVLSVFTSTIGCGNPSEGTASFTMDLETGAMAKLADFADVADPSFTQDVRVLVSYQCDEVDMGEDGSPFTTKFPAWSPTVNGLQLAWGERHVAPRLCAPIRVTVPWADATGCPFGAELPKDTDPRVCGPAPEDAIPAETEPFRIATPRGVYCYTWADYIECTAEGTGTAEDAGEWARVTLISGSSGVEPSLSARPEWTRPTDGAPTTTLQPGQSAAYGTTACLSQETGIYCWNTYSKHGFFMAPDRHSIW